MGNQLKKADLKLFAFITDNPGKDAHQLAADGYRWAIERGALRRMELMGLITYRGGWMKTPDTVTAREERREQAFDRHVAEWLGL